VSEHRSFPKPTPRLQERVQQRREAMRAWLVCCAAVDHRDRFICRCCGRTVRKTLTVCPERLEHHHIAARHVAPHLVTDVKNILAVCLSCHQKLTRHEMYIDGREEDMFVVEGKQFWNADCPLHFTQAEPAAG